MFVRNLCHSGEIPEYILVENQSHILLFPDQVSKLGKLKCKNEHDSVQDVKADDLCQMFLAMTEEVTYFFGCFSML